MDAALSAWLAPSALSRHLSPPEPRGLDALWTRAIGALPRLRRHAAAMRRLAQEARAHRAALATLDDPALTAALGEARASFRLMREGRPGLARGMALVAEAAARTLGLRAHHEQLIALAGIERGVCVEMATGEGKSLVAAMGAVLHGWRGRACHVFTANDYLAQRDCQWAAPLLERCALSAGFVIGSSDTAARRAAYARGVVWTTGREAAADFLRDALVLRAARRGAALPAPLADSLLMPRGLHSAIIDEADAVLIDEGVTPLILSGPAGGPDDAEGAIAAARLAESLTEGQSFRVDRRRREVTLTDPGRAAIESNPAIAGAGGEDAGRWASRRRREELVILALRARLFMQRGRDYVVQDGRVVIVDEFTGRTMPDRTWRDGLHRAVEIKEGLAPLPPTTTHARISFQRFFRLYQRLSGMSGTAREAAAELWSVYRLPVVRVPTHAPMIRRTDPPRLFPSAEAKRRAIVAEAAREQTRGRPVLIGTRSVDASERLSAALADAGVAHAVLNAVRHAEEARIVAQAGEQGRVTVATNMAGRGTDIRLGQGVAPTGGLRVIASEPHEARRIDRQLFGRAGRQGEPGSAVLYCARDDDLLVRFAGVWRLIPFTRWTVSAAARRAERSAARARAGVRRQDDWLDEALGFSGDRW